MKSLLLFSCYAVFLLYSFVNWYLKPVQPYSREVPSLEAAHLDTSNTVYIDDGFSCLDEYRTMVSDRTIVSSGIILVEESDFIFEKVKADGAYLALPFQEKYRKRIRDHPI